MERSEPALTSNEDASSTTELEDGFNMFQPVIDIIKFDLLCSIALRIRSSSEPSLTPGTEDGLTCAVDKTPMTGSYNIVYVLTFSDARKWAVRIPGNVGPFTELEAQRMNSVYGTMLYLHSYMPKKNKLKVPKVFHWSVDKADIGVPYALMQFVEGTPISDRWHDKSWVTEEKRLRILTNLAEAMSELHTLRFEKIGSLRFVEGVHDRISNIGAIVNVNMDGMGETREGCTPIGPYITTQEYLLDNSDDAEPDVSRAYMEVIRWAVESIPSHMTVDGSFTLSPPDFNYQNIFIDDDANITGLIDWDCVKTSPRGLGCARYPSWITRDWDPGMYGWPEETAIEENSPTELSRYRQHYAAVWKELDPPGYHPDQTKLSHILEAIKIAAFDQICGRYIVVKLIGHALRPEAPFTWPEFHDSLLAEDEKFEEWRGLIREGFRTMWYAEWETKLQEANLHSGTNIIIREQVHG